MRGAVAGVVLMLGGEVAHAQSVARRDTVSGRVIARDTTPIAGADVRVTSEHGITVRTRTDDAGAFLVVFTTSSGIYSVDARAFGYVAFGAVLERQPGTDRFERVMRLNPTPMSLPPVRVVASMTNEEHTTPAEQSARWLTLLTEQYPVDRGDLTDVAALSPGVTRSGSSGATLSILGLRPEQNRTTIDGSSYGGGSLPSEGVRSSGVITDTYDVSRGQFSGGQIMATTLSGTNDWGGGFNARVDDPALTFGGLAASRTAASRSIRLGGGGGGPLARNRVFFYGAADATRNTGSGSPLRPGDVGALERLGVSPDSVRRFLDIARVIGVDTASALGTGDSRRTAESVLGRLDVVLSERHTLTLRANGQATDARDVALSALGLSSGQNGTRTSDGGVLAQLGSVSELWANQLRAYGSTGGADAVGGGSMPTGEVLVTSAFANETTPTTLSFGTASSIPRQTHALLDLSDDLVRETESGAHRVKVGFFLQQQRLSQHAPESAPGSFEFQSLHDFELGRPSVYSRAFGGGSNALQLQTAGVHVGDVWKPLRGLGLIYGLRGDVAQYRASAENASRAPAFSAATARPRLDATLSPRLGFNYEPSSLVWSVDGGVGRFVGGSALATIAPLWADATPNAVQLTCVGDEAPTPEWQQYRLDSRAIPGTCANGVSRFAQQVPNATAFDRDFGAPQTFRASLGGSLNLGRLWGVIVNGFVANASRLPEITDINVGGIPRFALGPEDNRPVLVTPADIDATTGRVAPAAGRRDSTLGEVRLLQSNGESRTSGLSVQLVGQVRTVGLTLQYTGAVARVKGTGTPGLDASASTAGMPSSLEWSDSPFMPRHMFQMMASRWFGRWGTFAAIARLNSGTPFTPMVGGDVNGDGYANDRAFVFDPAATLDTALARSMASLLAASSGSVRDCLAAQRGRIAAPGGCRTPWSAFLDLRAQIYAIGNVNSRRLMFTVTASNVMAGLDYMVHGPSNLRGWGQYQIPDPTLLQIRGFDAQQRRFLYEVNQRFGQPIGGGASWLPFRLALQGRVTVGSDPVYQPMLRAVEVGRGGAVAQAHSELARRLINVPAELLQLDANDSGGLGLDAAQRLRLRKAADELRPQLQASVAALAELLTRRGAMTPLRTAQIQDAVTQARRTVEQGLRATSELLTTAQRERLPRWLTVVPDARQLIRPSGQAAVPESSP